MKTEDVAKILRRLEVEGVTTSDVPEDNIRSYLLYFKETRVIWLHTDPDGPFYYFNTPLTEQELLSVLRVGFKKNED